MGKGKKWAQVRKEAPSGLSEGNSLDDGEGDVEAEAVDTQGTETR